MDRRVVEQKFFEDAIGAILRAKMDNGVVPGRREAQVLTNDVRNRTE
jgi:hypothetical protein